MSENEPTPIDALDTGTVTDLADDCRRIVAAGRLRRTPARPWTPRCVTEDPRTLESSADCVADLDAFRA